VEQADVIAQKKILSPTVDQELDDKREVISARDQLVMNREQETADFIRWSSAGHLRQWRKLLICFGMLASIVLLNLFLGTKTFPSIVGIKCGSAWFYIV
jgi:hypothetical protein